MSGVNPSKSQYRLMLAICSAIPTSLTPPPSWAAYVDDSGNYYGSDITGHSKALEQLCKAGILNAVGDEDDFIVQLMDRDGFLLSWKSGAREARNGNGIHYIDYSDVPLAFAGGYMHWAERQKKGVKPYSLASFDVCHGFLESDSEEIWLQQ